MSKPDELIQKLCPNGVEWKELGEIANFRRGAFPQPYGNAKWYGGENSMPFVQVADVDDNFNLLANTKHRISTIAMEKSVFVKRGTVIVTLQGTIGRVAVTQYDCYIDRTLALFQDYKININKKYFAYQLKQTFDYEKKTARGSTLKTITKEEFTKFKIPLPPLEIQEEIVHILDSFTELTARRKQYEFYRDSLLTFGDEVEWKRLGDIATIIRGGNFQKKDFKDEGFPCIHYGQIYTKYGIKTKDTITFIDEKTFEKSKKAERNDIVMAVTSENIEDVCKCLTWLGDSDVAISGHTAIIKHNQNPLYLSYYFHTEIFYKQKLKLAHGTKVIEVTPSNLLDIKIPLPSLSEQERIVSILDKFDSLCNDITQGLPAEIEARQKQYEYYRDKLLTFKDVSENE